MKVLYGVNGNGSGHISRASLVVPKLQASGADVSCILSGRPGGAESYPDLSNLGTCQFKEGLSLIHNEKGGLDFIKTSLGIAKQSPRMLGDILRLDVSEFDLVVTDFEPISAWAAKKHSIPSIGLAHHFAFQHDVPKAGEFSPFMIFMNNIVPTDIPLGLHYASYDQPILPPIIDSHKIEQLSGATEDPQKVLVYMDFEPTEQVVEMLRPHKNHDFYVYASDNQQDADIGNIHIRKRSKDGFMNDFATAAGLIANAGFCASSEALQLGKKLLVKPASGQKEQESNALALDRLGYGSTMTDLNTQLVGEWLNKESRTQITFPDTAQHVADWITNNDFSKPQDLIDSLWRQVEVTHD